MTAIRNEALPGRPVPVPPLRPGPALTTPAAPQVRLLSGPALGAGPEPITEHLARLGRLPSPAERRDLVPVLEASGLLGRGGAAFPVGRKWRVVAERSRGDAVVLVNGAEGEPLSAKDRALMTLRPNLVLDGALVAASAVGAREVVLYVGAEHRDARASLARAAGERRSEAAAAGVRVRLVEAPPRYVAGEEKAAVHHINDGDARPTTGPRPFERGIGGAPTLVQNVESLAAAALIARYGDGWWREPGRGPARGTTLVTVTGAPSSGVGEVELGTTVGEVADRSAVRRDATEAVLLGGYFGGWVAAGEAWDLALDPTGLRDRGLGLGCGVVAVLGRTTCGVAATARIMDYMAGQSAAQCGPCVFGLRAIADATGRIATLSAGEGDLDRIARWAGQLAGRGACRHPDGAVALVASALRVFDDEFSAHQWSRACTRPLAAVATPG